MENFPATFGHWLIQSSHNSRIDDPTMRSPFAAGYIQRAAHATWVPRVFTRELAGLTDAEVAALEVFQETVNFGASTFYWEDTQSDTIFQVAFHESCLPLRFELFGGRADRWKTSLAFVQTTPNELDANTYSKTFRGGYAMIDIENLAPGADISDRPVFATAYGCTLSKIGILTKGAPSGIDDSNTVVLTVKNSLAQTIVTKTYNTANQPPTSGFADIGSPAITEIGAGTIITLDVACGATANMPPFTIILE